MNADTRLVYDKLQDYRAKFEGGCLYLGTISYNATTYESAGQAGEITTLAFSLGDRTKLTVDLAAYVAPANVYRAILELARAHSFRHNITAEAVAAVIKPKDAFALLMEQS